MLQQDLLFKSFEDETPHHQTNGMGEWVSEKGCPDPEEKNQPVSIYLYYMSLILSAAKSRFLKLISNDSGSNTVLDNENSVEHVPSSVMGESCNTEQNTSTTCERIGESSILNQLDKTYTPFDSLNNMSRGLFQKRQPRGFGDSILGGRHETGESVALNGKFAELDRLFELGEHDLGATGTMENQVLDTGISEADIADDMTIVSMSRKTKDEIVISTKNVEFVIEDQ